MSNKLTKTIVIHQEEFYAKELQIDEIIDRLTEFKEQGATKVGIEAGSNWDTPYCDLEIFYERLETDDEPNTRLKSDEFEFNRQKEYAEKQIKDLKQKFGIVD